MDAIGYDTMLIFDDLGFHIHYYYYLIVLLIVIEIHNLYIKGSAGETYVFLSVCVLGRVCSSIFKRAHHGIPH